MSEWWTPPPLFVDTDVFIIGGGPSLNTFNFNLLKNKNVVGCNSAFRLGVDLCPITVFGDIGFFENFEPLLKDYSRKGGTVITCQPTLCLEQKGTWFRKMKRETKGLGTGNALGWNGNTGALAVNLALSMGAKRVLLLGFDMQLSGTGNPNWHEHQIEKPNEVVYQRFKLGFDAVKGDLKTKFEGKEIINLNLNSSLETFPKQHHRVFLRREKPNDIRWKKSAQV